MAIERLLTVLEFAALIGVDKQTVYRRLWAKEVGFIDIAPPGAKKARIRIRESAAEKYLQSRESAGKAA
jgi:predicted site-specific integrase-resolvase